MSSQAYGAGLAVLKRGLRCKFIGLAVAIVLGVCHPSAVWAQTIKLLALGDSLTAGHGLAQNDGFVPQLQRWLVAQNTDVVVVNAGVSGDTTAGGKARLGWSLTDDIDAVLVNLGGNDMLRGLPPEETQKNLDAILSELTARDLPILLVRVPASMNFGAAQKNAFDATYPELAEKYESRFVPNYFAALQEQPDQREVMQTLMQPDGIHPSAKGVALIVEKIGPVVLSLIQRVSQQKQPNFAN